MYEIALTESDYLLDDITLLYDEEITEEQWWQFARREYFMDWQKFTTCNFEIGRMCLCGRKPGHRGPHMGMQLDVQSVPPGDGWNPNTRLRVDVRRTYPVAEPASILPGLADVVRILKYS